MYVNVDRSMLMKYLFCILLNENENENNIKTFNTPLLFHKLVFKLLRFFFQKLALLDGNLNVLCSLERP